MAYEHLSCASKTDVGRKRKNNEDSHICLPQCGIFCVADGMGGMSAGDMASGIVVAAMREAFENDKRPLGASEKAASVIAALRVANTRVRDAARSRGLAQVGSTVVVAAFDGKNPEWLTIVHAGDSRCYCFRNGELTQQTTDHSVAQAAGVDEKKLSAIFRGVVTRAIGTVEEIDPERTDRQTQPGDLYLICSDGLTRMVQDRDIAKILADHAGESLQQRADALVAAANAAGGDDNVTAILIAVGSWKPGVVQHDEPDRTGYGDDEPATSTSVGVEMPDSKRESTAPKKVEGSSPTILPPPPREKNATPRDAASTSVPSPSGAAASLPTEAPTKASPRSVVPVVIGLAAICAIGALVYALKQGANKTESVREQSAVKIPAVTSSAVPVEVGSVMPVAIPSEAKTETPAIKTPLTPETKPAVTTPITPSNVAPVTAANSATQGVVKTDAPPIKPPVTSVTMPAVATASTPSNVVPAVAITGTTQGVATTESPPIKPPMTSEKTSVVTTVSTLTNVVSVPPPSKPEFKISNGGKQFAVIAAGTTNLPLTDGSWDVVKSNFDDFRRFREAHRADDAMKDTDAWLALWDELSTSTANQRAATFKMRMQMMQRLAVALGQPAISMPEPMPEKPREICRRYASVQAAIAAGLHRFFEQNEEALTFPSKEDKASLKDIEDWSTDRNLEPDAMKPLELLETEAQRLRASPLKNSKTLPLSWTVSQIEALEKSVTNWQSLAKDRAKLVAATLEAVFGIQDIPGREKRRGVSRAELMRELPKQTMAWTVELQKKISAGPYDEHDEVSLEDFVESPYSDLLKADTTAAKAIEDLRIYVFALHLDWKLIHDYEAGTH